MNCKEFQKFVVDHWPIRAGGEGPAAEHLRICKECGELFRFLEACRCAPGETMSAVEAERIRASVKRSPAKPRPAKKRGLFAFGVAAVIILTVAIATLLYVYRLPVKPVPTAERVKKVEMYIHKTGTPESAAIHLYLEVHQKEKR